MAHNLANTTLQAMDSLREGNIDEAVGAVVEGWCLSLFPHQLK